MIQDKVRLEFKGGHYGFTRGAEDGHMSDIWVFEVRYKPLRMIRVNVTDPKTGEKSRELIWYLVYRAVLRPQERRVELVAGADVHGTLAGARIEFPNPDAA